jgi:predicted Zn-dependent peptidase
VAGAFDQAAMAELVAARFDGMAEGSVVTARGIGMGEREPRFAYVHEPGSQTEVRLSFHTPGVRSPEAPVFLLLERILDDGLSTRVHRIICEERGIAYDAFAGNDTFEDCGVFDFGASVAHEKTPYLVETTLELIRELRDRGLEQEEVDKAKRRFLWDLRSVRDDTETTVHFVGGGALFGLPEEPRVVAEQVANVSADDVQRAVRTHLDTGKAYLTCVGVLDESLRADVAGLVRA